MFEVPVLNRSRILIRNMPEESLKVFCELVASAETTLNDSGARKFFLRLASRIPPELTLWLFEKRFPLRPFLENIDPKRIFPGFAGPSPALRNKWRLLKKRLFSAVQAQSDNDPNGSSSRGLDTTLADLRPLVIARRPERVRGAWRTHGKAVTARRGAWPDGFCPAMKHLYWGGAKSRQIAFWESLVRSQAAELTEIRRLAHEVSRRTGRVVLNWHNASLGAAGGWAFEAPAASFESPALYGNFVREVLKESSRIRKSFDFSSAMELCSMRVKRLFVPKLAHAEIPAMGEPGTADRSKYEWPGALALHQKILPGQVLSWIERARRSWAEGLILLFALANHGQRVLDSGGIDSLVLPWMDKFFISSRRQADVAYLERLFRFASANIESPLVLFWDDTPHASEPSLGLALDRMAGAGLPVRGLGIFNTGISEGHAEEREQAVRIIPEQYPRKALFALRPINENHCPGAYRQIFEDFDQSFFVNYDSSWKDNLAFLYAGTQVFPLLGTQTEMECVSPWIVMGGKRYAFGAWFRRILRQISLGGSHGPHGHLHLEYCSWANLL